LRRGLAAFVISACAIIGCEVDAGRVDVRFDWAADRPEPGMWIHARVEARDDVERDGQILVVAEPIAHAADTRIDLPAVPNGANRVVIVEVRATSEATSALYYRGISSRFELRAGATSAADVMVPLSPAPRFDGPSLRVVGGDDEGRITTATVTLELTLRGGTTVELDPTSAFLAPTRLDLAPLKIRTASTGATIYRVRHHFVRDGRHTLHARISDQLGYRSQVVSAHAIVDTVPPTLATSSVHVFPPAQSILPEATAAAPGAIVEITFTVSELTRAVPRLVGIAAPVQATGTTFTARAPWAGAPEGRIEITAFVTDLAGHTSVLDLGSFDSDATPPAAIDVAAVQYRRHLGAGTYTVSADAGAVEPEATVIVYDGPDPTRAAELARIPSDALGAIPGAPVIADDPPFVWLRAVDGAGNPGPITQVDHGQWIAAFADAELGRASTNPHQLEATRAMAAHRDVGPSPATVTIDQAALDALGRDDDVLFRVRATPLWRRRDPTPAEPSGRFGGVLTADPIRGRVIAFGGAELGGGFRSDAWAYDGYDWQLLTSSRRRPTGRNYPALSFDRANGQVFLFGGHGNGIWGDTWHLGGGDWSPLAPDPAPSVRYGAMIAADSHRSRVVLFGGDLDGTRSLNDLWEWDGAAWHAIQVAEGPAPRNSGVMAYDYAREQTVLFGGVERDTGTATNYADTWTWDGARWTEHTLEPHPPSRAFAGMSYDPRRGRVVLIGGAALQPTAFRSDVWEWDGAAWHDATPVGGPPDIWDTRLEWSEALGQILLWGTPVVANATPQLWSWDGTTFTDLTPTGLTPGTLGGAAASYVPSLAQVVLFGGEGPSALSDQTWLFDGRQWHASDATGPGARRDAAVATSTAGDGAVMYGGRDGVALGDTWWWSAGAWTEVAGTGPSARWGHVLVTTPTGVLAHGGTDGSTLADLWRFANGVWTEVAQAGLQPSARASHGAVIDGSGDVLMFGGAGEGGLLADTWHLRGGQWTELTPTSSPPPRSGHTMVYHQQRDQVLLFGGLGASGPLNDVWSWDGATWTEISSAARPPPRAFHSSVFMPRGQTIVTHGGDGLGDTWLFEQPANQRPAVIARFDVTAARVEHIVAIDLSTEAGPAGVELAAWNVTGLRWDVLSSNDGGDRLVASIDPALYLQGGILHVAVRGEQTVTSTPELAIDVIELQVSYEASP